MATLWPGSPRRSWPVSADTGRLWLPLLDHQCWLVNRNLTQLRRRKKLGVQYILNGSVRRSGDRIRVSASLSEGGTGHQIWSEQYDHVLDDIFQVQDEVAQRIVTMLVGKIEQSDRERSLQKETDNLSAYECVLQGRYYFGDWHGVGR